MLRVNDNLAIPLEEIDLQAIRSQGAGGQNVNKVSSAVHLRFDVTRSSLPEGVKQRLLKISDKRITKDGVIVIKSQQHRRQEQNREAALQRLAELVREASILPKKRRPTKPSKGSVRRRLESKTRQSKLKASRGKIDFD